MARLQPLPGQHARIHDTDDDERSPMQLPRNLRPSLPRAALLLALLTTAACGTTWPRRDPTGEVLPSVRGTSLADEHVTLPDVARGEPLLLLIGYDQDAQFDLDRWLLALDQVGWQTRSYEVPTIPGLFPRLLRGTIDGGMRRGIPAEDWASVVTVYGDAAQLAEFTGNEDGLTGRIVLLDGDGRVAFFHDRGFSVGTLKRLQAARAALPPAPAERVR